MTDQELQQLRREKWRLEGNPTRTIEQARAFLEDVGFCLMYPKRPALLVPTFIGAFVGSEDRLPGWQHAFKDPRAAEATELLHQKFVEPRLTPIPMGIASAVFALSSWAMTRSCWCVTFKTSSRKRI